MNGNAGYFEFAYAFFWALMFGYLVYLHREVSRLEKGKF